MLATLHSGTVKLIITSELLNTSSGLSLTMWLVSQFNISDKFLLINSCVLRSKPPMKFVLESFIDFLTSSLPILPRQPAIPMLINFIITPYTFE
jgi:hypothetical protein